METAIRHHRTPKPISPEHYQPDFQLQTVVFGVKNITLAINLTPAALAQYTEFAL